MMKDKNIIENLPKGFILRLKPNSEDIEIILSTIPPQKTLFYTFNEVNNLINNNYKDYIQNASSDETIIKEISQCAWFFDSRGILLDVPKKYFCNGSIIQIPEINFNISRSFEELIGVNIFKSNDSPKIGYAFQNINFSMTMDMKKQADEGQYESMQKYKRSCSTHLEHDYFIEQPFVIFLRHKSNYPFLMAYICNDELLVPIKDLNKKILDICP